jgi:hypothetical protein
VQVGAVDEDDVHLGRLGRGHEGIVRFSGWWARAEGRYWVAVCMRGRASGRSSVVVGSEAWIAVSA